MVAFLLFVLEPRDWECHDNNDNDDDDYDDDNNQEIAVHRDELCRTVFAARQKQHKKYANSVYSKQAIDAAFKKLSDAEVLKVCPAPPNTPTEVITFASLQCQQTPLYMAGKYTKEDIFLSFTFLLVDLLVLDFFFIVTARFGLNISLLRKFSIVFIVIVIEID